VINLRAIFFCFLLCSDAWADTPIPSTAQYCDLAVPPPESGESENHGDLMKVFPRRSSAGADFTGCQSMWIFYGDHWLRVSLMYFEHRTLKAWWTLDDYGHNTGTTCWFEGGHLKSNQSSGCYEPADKDLAPSLAPSCMDAGGGKAKAPSDACFKSLDSVR
jgi:hypothetical protein